MKMTRQSGDTLLVEIEAGEMSEIMDIRQQIEDQLSVGEKLVRFWFRSSRPISFAVDMEIESDGGAAALEFERECAADEVRHELKNQQ